MILVVRRKYNICAKENLSINVLSVDWTENERNVF